MHFSLSLPSRYLLLAVLSALVMAGHDSALAQRPLGIDVSSYQGGSINWTSVKASGITFAWAKATEGAGVNDADFTVNANNGKAAGVYMGAYHYAHPELNSPATEASHFWSVAGSKITADGLTLMPMLDIEGSAFSGTVGAANISDWINAWCTDVIQSAANAGVSIKPAIYVSACNACPFNSTVSQWFCDIANYSGNDAQTSNPWTACSGCERWGAGGWQFWQYTSSGSIPGISGNVDHDVFNGTAAGLVATMIATASTNSTIYYWDPQGTTAGNPYTGSMSGTWENAKWSYSSAGLSSPVNWVDGKAACFGVHTGIGTPAYTITMDSSHVVAGFFDGGLAPNSCDVTIQGAGIINLASGPQGLDPVNASDGSLGIIRINCVIAGDGILYPEGNGQSYLHGANTFSGGVTLGYNSNPFKGIVNFNNGSAFGTGPITLWNYGNGGALVLEGTSPVTVTNNVQVTAATTNNIVGNPAGLTFSGNWSMGANLLTLGASSSAANQTIISGAMTGTAGFTIYNSGTVVLSGVNTYSGTTTINSPAVLTIGGAGQLGSGAYAGNIVIGGTFNYNSSAAQTLSGTISGAGPLKQNNAGTLILTHANTYSGGTTVSSGGTLCIAADSALGAAAGALTLNGGCLKNNNSAPVLGSGRTITLGAAGGYFDAGWAPANPVTINSKLTGAGSLLIDLDGSPVVLANTANNYTGDTVIGTNGPGFYAAGTQACLKLGAAGVIPNGAGKGNVVINQAYNGLLDLAGFNQTINGLSGDGVITNSTGNSVLTVGNNNQSSLFSGVIQNTSGRLAVTKIGSGILTLGGSNTYTGNTLINGGTLALGSSGALAATTNINLGAGTTLDVSAISSYAWPTSASLSAGGASSPATLKGGNTIDLGPRPLILTYDGVHPALSIPQGTLLLNGNAFTVNGAALPTGSYTLVQQASGNITATGTFPVSGTAIGSGTTGTLSVSGGSVTLTIKGNPVFTNLTSSQSVTYGTSSISLRGKISAPGPLYPASGETVYISINSNTQSTTITNSSGDFSINYNLAGIAANASFYPITYAYSGNGSLNSATNSATTLLVNPLPVTLSGSRSYDGTTSAGASILSISNSVGSDVVVVSSGSATLASANVGPQPISTMGTLTLGGAASANYTLTGASGSVLITPAAFSIISGVFDASGTNFILTWESSPGGTYQVIGNIDPSAALNTWSNIGNPITAAGTNTSATNPITSPVQVFEVKGQ
jgi:autotransporter-associated beta strand protein